MRTEIRAALDATRVDSDGRMDTAALIEPLVKLDAVWRAGNKKWLRDFQITGPYFDVIAPALRAARDSQTSQRLVDILDNAQIQSLEDELFTFLNSLPRQYTIHFPIRSATDIVNTEVKISDQLAVCSRPTQAAPSNTGLPLNQLLSNALLSSPPLVARTTLRVPTSGYIESSADDSGSQTALSVLRQFVGMSIASNVIAFRSLKGSQDFDKFEIVDRQSQITSWAVLPVPVASLLKRVTFPAESFESIGAIPAGTMKIAAPFIKQFDAIAHALNTPREDGQHLRTAAEWLFDSEAESNETTALLFASIGLEAALDSPTKETTARLGDRLAWSLGGSLSDRKKMSEEYSQFYRVRCNVVHGRDRQLDDDARQKLAWGKTMLRKIIAKELDRPHD